MTPERRAALSLLRRGEITISEAAELAGVSRQLVYAWCKRAKIEPAPAREGRITKAWRKEIRSGVELRDRGAIREE